MVDLSAQFETPATLLRSFKIVTDGYGDVKIDFDVSGACEITQDTDVIALTPDAAALLRQALETGK